MTKVNINITKSQISKYAVISEPGTYKVMASGQNNKYYNTNLEKDTYLVNIKAIEGRKVQSMIDAFGDREEIDLSEIKNLTMVHTIIINDSTKEPDLPLKDQEVKISVEWATNKITGEFVLDTLGKQILNIRQMVVPGAKTPETFKFEDDLVKEEVPETREGVSLAKSKVESEEPSIF